MINYTDDYTGKVAVVTGAARGIGKETATRISKNGAKVALWDYDEKNIQLLSEKIGNNSIPLKVDVSDENSIKNAAEIVRDKLGIPSLLVNCAGVAGDNATVADTDPNEWRRVININLTGTFLCCRELVSGMVNNNYGRIVNIASVAGKEGNPNAAHYSASKAGVITFTRSLAKEVSSSGVLVNSITPAVIDTEMLSQVSEEH
ncbi:uncharacterized protein METZ01_LOCUS261144, partial [marine metagenome]